MNAQELTAALAGRWHGSYGTARCPAHEDRNPSLQLSDGDTAILLKCHAGCESRSVIAALKARGLWPDHGERSNFKPAHRPPQRRRDDDDAQRTQWARQRWNRAVPARGTPVETYLGVRGYTGSIPDPIRYLPGEKQADTGLILPVMIAGITKWPDSEICAIHRTYLRADGKGKAGVSRQKMMLGPVGGGAVRLAPHGSELVVAEGIETSLILLQETGLPVWSALSAGGIESLILPDDVREVIIAADNDASGRGIQAANKAARKWTAQGKKVRICQPPVVGWDFADMASAPDNLAYLRREVANG